MIFFWYAEISLSLVEKMRQAVNRIILLYFLKCPREVLGLWQLSCIGRFFFVACIKYYSGGHSKILTSEVFLCTWTKHRKCFWNYQVRLKNSVTFNTISLFLLIIYSVLREAVGVCCDIDGTFSEVVVVAVAIERLISRTQPTRTGGCNMQF